MRTGTALAQTVSKKGKEGDRGEKRKTEDGFGLLAAT
jgi:hypothetical protein